MAKKLIFLKDSSGVRNSKVDSWKSEEKVEVFILILLIKKVAVSCNSVNKVGVIFFTSEIFTLVKISFHLF